MRGLLGSRSRLGAAAAIAALLVTATVGVSPASAQPSVGVMGAGTNDFTGDGRADLLALYDYGNGEAGLFVWPGTPEIRNQITRPRTVWWEPPGSYWASDMKITSGGDFNGDGYDDVLAIYRYTEGYGIYVYPGSPTLDSNTAATPYQITFIDGSYSLANTQITAGDFTGDGLADLQLMQYFGVGETALRIVPGTTSRAWGSGTWYEVWRSARYPGSFALPSAQIASADFTRDGRDDLLALYNYGNGEFALWVFPGTNSTSAGSVNQYWCWHSTSHDDLSGATLDTGDIDGNGYKDLVVVKGNTMWVVPGTDQAGDYATNPYAYYVGPLNNTKSVVGDYDGNGFSDLMSLKDFGNGSQAMYVIKGGVPNWSDRYMEPVWGVPAGNFWLSAMKVA